MLTTRHHTQPSYRAVGRHIRTMEEPIRIGYWIPELRKKKIKFDRFVEHCRRAGARCIELDLTQPLEGQGPFDVIFHKINDEKLVAEECIGEEQARAQVRLFQRFIDAHPGIPILDNLTHIVPLHDRTSMFQQLQKFESVKNGVEIFVPSFVEITAPMTDESYTRIRNAGIKFPLVCKPSDATNPHTAHDMSLVFNERGLQDVTTPCVAQSFINHNGVLHKLFIVGSKSFLVQRPSIRNLYAGDYATEHFKTKEVSKSNSSSHLIEPGDDDEEPLYPDADVMHELGQSIRRVLGINLLGVDVIVERKTGRCGLIDVNPFPGFDGVANIPEYLKECVLEQAYLYRKRIKQGDS